jgi:hypothetical protein
VKLVAALCLLAGCDVMFKLKTVEAPIPPDVFVCGSPDEDGDCVADEVDNCPGIANASQVADGEVDTPAGAGDSCDPDPAVAGHAVKRFTGFVDPTVDQPQWEPVMTWRFDEGQLTKLTMSPQGAVRHLAIDDDADLTVEAAFVLHTYDMAAPDPRLGLWVDVPDTGLAGQTCWLSLSNNRVYVQERTGDPSNNSKAVDIPPVPAESRVVLQFRRDRAAGRIRCTATINGARSDVTTTASGAWLTMGHIALQAKDLLADAEYVTVYAR